MSLDKAGQQFTHYLNDLYGGDTTYLHSRASGLLYRFLVAFGQQGTGVIIPSASGFSLPQIVISAGYIPIFADVQSADFNLGLPELESAAEHAECKVTICLAIHSFGHFLDLEPIANYCKLNEVVLIEDICQLIGTGNEGKYGDLVLASFGKHKSLDGGAGGALVIRNKKFSIGFYPDPKSADLMVPVTADVESNFISTYYRIRDAEKSGKTRGALSRLTSSNLKYITSGSVTPEWTKVAIAAQTLAYDNEIRRRNSNYFLRELSGIEEIELPVYAKESAPWRFTFQCRNIQIRDELVSRLRHEVVHASNWYSSLSLDFVEFASHATPVSDKFEKSVINLLVDTSVSQEYLNKCVKTIRNFF